MQKSLLLSTAVGLTMAMAFAGSSVAAANHQTTVMKAARQLLPLPAGEHKIQATVLSTNSVYGTAFSGDTTLETQTVTCKSKTTCTLAMSSIIQACSFTGEYPQSQLATAVTVDGTYIDGGPYAGSTETSDVCDIIPWQGVYAVAPGSHTVTWQVYNSGESFVARNVERTDVTKP